MLWLGYVTSHGQKQNQMNYEATPPNGLISFSETLFFISYHLSIILENEDANKIPPYLQNRYELGGIGELMELAMNWAMEFERINKDREWDGEWYDELEAFLDKKVNNVK